MKTIRDQLTGTDVTINLINTGRSATLTMCANGRLLTETVRGDAWSMAKVAYAKRDLESFGSFFDERAEKAEAAA
jgi:hypothetical protein